MKGRLVWPIGVFFIGLILVWVQLSAKCEFLKVANIHDLFDIIGATATSVALVYAIKAINGWKAQVRGTSDHDLATKLIVALRRYSDEIPNTWSYAESAIVQIKNNTWIGEGGSGNPLIPIYRDSIEAISSLRAQLEPLELQAAEIWGGIFETQFTEIYRFESLFCWYIDRYVHLLIRGVSDERASLEAMEAINNWNTMIHNDLGNFESAMRTIQLTIEPLRRNTKAKLIGEAV